jgi:hypothetical protein
MNLNLNQYPQAIFKAAESVNNLEAEISRLRLQMSRIEGVVDEIIATDNTLKNDALRKSEKFVRLANHPDYPKLQDRLINLGQEKSNSLAYLELLRNEFSALKLSTRQEIAVRLAGVESRELLGL